MPKGEEGNGGFFVAGGQAAVLLEAAKKALDFVAVAVGFLVHCQGFYPVGMAGNDGFDALFGAIGAGCVAVVSRVGQHFARLQVRQQGQRLWAVARLPFGGNQTHGVAQRLNAGVNFGADAPAAASEALGGGVAFFWPAEC